MTLYYEVHVTIDPAFDKLAKIKEVARVYKYKMADLLMVKNDGEEEQHVKDMFFTTRTKDYRTAEMRVKEFCKCMKMLGVNVRRYKIEDTVLDSRSSDVFKILA